MKQNSHESPLNSVSLQKLLSLLEINRGTADQSEGLWKMRILQRVPAYGQRLCPPKETGALRTLQSEPEWRERGTESLRFYKYLFIPFIYP